MKHVSIGTKLAQGYMDFARGTKSFSLKNPLFLLWGLLIPISWCAKIWINATDFLYRHGLRRSYEPPLPIISVGNITYGGTNKTPFVDMLCRSMQNRGVKVGVVSRGYGGDNADVVVLNNGRIISPQNGDSDRDLLNKNARRVVGDEPILLSSRLSDVPVVVSRDRMKGIENLAQKEDIHLIVADDAFQHRRLSRDVDIVLVDATCPFGNGRTLPAGILREDISALARAHMVVITRVDQVTPEELFSLRKRLLEIVPIERIFNARLDVVEWLLWDGVKFRPTRQNIKGLRLLAFSAIGNPPSFINSLKSAGAVAVSERHFLDHHSYSEHDMMSLCKEKNELKRRGEKIDFLSCTEKDIYNLPPSWRTRPSPCPLLVPSVAVTLEDRARFESMLIEHLRPRLVVASNGYGEDAIGVLLAEKLRNEFRVAEVLAFPLVGRGEPYIKRGFSVVSSPSVTPSGGILKYHLKDIWRDLRSGLLKHIYSQQMDWRGLSGVRTPLCVGDVYLLLHTLWGHGTSPLFVATAKTVRLSGHWRLERFIIRMLCRRTWTRDGETAEQLLSSGADALYAGNPIMDLLEGAKRDDFSDSKLILLLPGSRTRAYDDVKLLLDAAELINLTEKHDYIMTAAPTIDMERLVSGCIGWRFENSRISKNDITILIHRGGVQEAASDASLLIGFGGTANQLCAGMGIPVISIDEKGKRVQKKLLGDAEILVAPTSQALAECALRVLGNSELYSKMSEAGRARMGEGGALDDVTRYAAESLGWRVRCELYERLIGNGAGI
ncbi:tetraacyldisaccharide 4'-kinase [Synergistales bacterium]|nr:tetraacyldisaccharide 4'-kinase [Synergistales bacterium]